METLAELTKKIERLRDNMTGCKWMAVLPQLISRICHKEQSVHLILSVRVSLHRVQLNLGS
jgi:hypothetical protein